MNRIDELKADILATAGVDLSIGDVDQMAVRGAQSMEVYADGDGAICLGDWKAWRHACIQEGRTIPPAEFKALPKEKRLSYIPKIF